MMKVYNLIRFIHKLHHRKAYAFDNKKVQIRLMIRRILQIMPVSRAKKISMNNPGTIFLHPSTSFRIKAVDAFDEMIHRGINTHKNRDHLVKTSVETISVEKTDLREHSPRKRIFGQ